MNNIEYYKFGLDRYLNNFQSDKNSGLYEYHLIREELVKIDEQVKDGTFSEKEKLTLYIVDSTGKEYSIKSEKSIKKYIEDNEKYEK